MLYRARCRSYQLLAVRYVYSYLLLQTGLLLQESLLLLRLFLLSHF